MPHTRVTKPLTGHAASSATTITLMSTRVRSFCKINLGLAVGPATP